MMTLSPIGLGTDSAVLHSPDFDSHIDPSGFTQCGFDAHSTKKVVTLAQEAWSTIVRSLPKNLPIPLPSNIFLYMEKTHARQEGPAGAMSHRFDRSLASIEQRPTDTDCTINVLTYPVPEVRGIILSFTPEMLQSATDDIYEILIHEMFHMLTHQALAASHVLAEAFVERMTHHVLTRRKSRELRHLNWNPKAFAGTCGFRIDDFAEVRRNDSFRDVMRIYALNSLADISYEDMWSISSELLRQAHRSKFCPSSMDVLRTMKSAIGNSKMEDIVGSVIIRPLKEGKQCFFCPFGNELFAFCVNVRANTQYLHAPLKEFLSWDKYQFVVTDDATQLTVIATDVHGKVREKEMELRGERQFSFKTLDSLLESDIDSIRYRALGIETVLKRSAGE